MNIKTFFSSVEAELKKLFISTSWEQKVQSTILYVAPILETIVSLVDPIAAPAVASVVRTIQSDLATVSTVVQNAQVQPGTTAMATVSSALSSISTNLQSLLTAAEVKNSAKAAQITATVTLLSGEVQAMISNLPGAASTAVIAPGSLNVPKV